MKVALLAPSGTVAAALERLLEVAQDEDEFILISAAQATPAGIDVVRVGSDGLPPRNAITRALSRSAVGRNLLRLTPWDGGRRFARAVGRDQRARASVQRSDLVVALERDSILAAWRAGRGRSPSPRAVYGVAAARAMVSRERS